MKTLVPSVKYVNIKQWPLSSPPFTPAKAFEGNRFHFFLRYFIFLVCLTFSRLWESDRILKFF